MFFKIYCQSILILTCFIFVLPVSTTAKPTDNYLHALHLMGKEQYEPALKVLKKIQAGEAAFKAIDKIFDIHQINGNLERAENYFQELSENKATRNFGLYGQAKVLYKNKQFQPAIQILESIIENGFINQTIMTTLRRCHAHNGSRKTMRSFFESQIRKDSTNSFYWYGLAHSYYEKGTFRTALKLYDKVLLLNPEIYKAHLWKLHIFFKKTGEYHRGIKTGLWLIQQEAVKQDSEFLSLCFNTLGLLYYGIGHFSKSIDYFQQALALSEKLGLKLKQSGILGNLISVCSTTGDPRILEYFPKAVQFARQTNRPDEVMRYTISVGMFYQTIGNYAKALEFFQDGLDYAYKNQVTHSGYIASTLISLSKIMLEKGQYAVAADSLNKALEIFKSRNSITGQADCLLALGTLFQKTEQFNRAISDFQKALKIFQTSHDFYQEGVSLNALGQVYSLKKKPGKAREMYRKSLNIAHKMDYQQLAAAAQTGLARLLENSGNLQLAASAYKSAIELIENFRNQLLVDDLKTGFQESKVEIYEWLIHLLLKLNSNQANLTAGHDAFYYLELGKARSLLDAIGQRQTFQNLAVIDEDFQIQYLANLKKLEGKQNEMAREIQAEPDSQNFERIDVLKAEIAAFQKEQSDLLLQLNQEYPEYTKFMNPPVLMLKEVQEKILTPGQVLIEYFVSEAQIFVWIIRQDQVHLEKIPRNRKWLRQKIAGVSETLFGNLEQNTNNRTAEKTLPTHSWANIQTDSLFSLYQEIFQPLEKYLKTDDKIVLVPDDWLYYFPFEMLVTQIHNMTPRYLVEKYPVIYASSASSLNPELTQPVAPEMNLLAFANPDLTGNKNTGIFEYLNDTFSCLFRDNRFVSLPHSELEVQTIAGEIENSEVYTGKQATEETFKNRAGQFRYIHFATHHVLNEQHPLLSQLLLTPGAGDEDGFLNLFEILNSRLNAELVVLSACNSGRGKYSRATGLFSMSHAFKCAGVANVLASLWWVEDACTAFLMQRFYQYLENGFSKTTALQQAKIDVIKRGGKQVYPAVKNPFYWAPFVLIGRGE